MEQIIAKVKEASVDNKLTCKQAFELAEQLQVPLAKVGQAADEAEVKIYGCQLGCF